MEAKATLQSECVIGWKKIRSPQCTGRECLSNTPMSLRRKGRESASSSSSLSPPSCLLELLASTWVDFWHAAFASRKSLEEENERIRMSAVQKDLDSCYSMLQQRELELQHRVAHLGRQAVMYKNGKNLSGARKKMLERARAQAQLEKIQNSILMIEMHKSTLEGASMDISVLETLKASGDALRQMGATGEGLQAVEKLISGLEESMQSAAEITQVLSSGSVSGMVNSMAAFGTVVDEDEIMKELDEMTLGEEEGANAKDDVLGLGIFTENSTTTSLQSLPPLPKPPATAAAAGRSVTGAKSFLDSAAEQKGVGGEGGGGGGDEMLAAVA